MLGFILWRRTMSYASAFRDELLKRISEAQQETLTGLVSGHADLSEYKYQCGVLRGMQIAASLCDGIAEDLNRD